MRFKATFVSISLLFNFVIVKASPSTDTVLARYKRYFLNATSIKGVDSLVPSIGFNLNSASQWPDINYADISPAYWQIREHIGRVKILAVAYTSPASKYYKNQQVWQTLSNALDNWLLKRYKNSNWWVNEIGVPQDMRDVLVLIGSSLSANQRNQSLEVLAQHKVRGVGANLIWSADLAIHYGALVNDDAMIKQSVDLITKEIKISTGEGIQPDYSYHQHGERLQIYHYGNSFLETNVRIAWEMRGTSWNYPPEKISILTNFILNGWQWMSRGINTVPGTIDRAASRKDQLHNADLRSLIPYLSDLAPGYRSTFSTIAARQNGKGEPLNRFKYFPYSDFAAYHHNNFSFLLKTISTRTLPSESINTENLKGRLLNNGDAYLISNGNEYFNLMPAWNWNFLPGQTNSNTNTDSIVRMPFAGSVTDGKAGLTAMHYAVANAGENITAHKFWASNGNTIVCLISGLKANGINDSIFTALDQSRWQARVDVNKPGNTITAAGTNEIKNVSWIHHANFGYILFKPSTVQVQLKVVITSWSTINESASKTPVTEKVFMPLLYHDRNSTATGYVLVNATTSKEVENLANNPTWKILKNDEKCQVVSFNDGTTMAAFFAAGTFEIEKQMSFTVDKPCLIQITRDRIYISDPLHIGGVINFRLSGKTYSATLKNDGTTVNIKR